MENKYNKNFYKKQNQWALSAAKEIVPEVLKLLNPQSVVDVGCGTGGWLKIYKENGVKEILGIDGKWINKKKLLIDIDDFLEYDLLKSLQIKKFDLVTCLEVAEHLPLKNADQFINDLTKIGDYILFSAAIPFQGGKNHLNEQWQSWWAELFNKNNFLPTDYLRKIFWNNKKIEWFYRQNMILYIKKEELINNEILIKNLSSLNNFPLSVVHPEEFLSKASPENIYIKQYLLILPLVIKEAIKKIIIIFKSLFK